MKYPRALDELLHEHGKVRTNPPDYMAAELSFKLAELMYVNSDHVMQWYISEAAHQFMHSTDFNVEPINPSQMPHQTMVIESGALKLGTLHGDNAPAALIIHSGKFDADRHTKNEAEFADRYDSLQELDLVLQPCLYRKFEPNRKPYWGYLPEQFVISAKSASEAPSWLRFDTQSNEIEFRIIDKPDQLGVYAISHPQFPNSGTTPVGKEGRGILANGLAYLVKLLQLLECNNLPVKTITPSPLKQKIARERKKAPLRPYRILNLTNQELRDAQHFSTGNKPTGTSVRTHLRRGHLRNCKTAKGHVRRWIKPCIVNAHHGDQMVKEIVVT